MTMSDFDKACDAAWQFVKDKLVCIKLERGLSGVWLLGFRTGWDAVERADAKLTPDALNAALVEYRRWMPGHSGRIGNETFFVCREKDDGEVEWLARHPTAEAMRDDLDRRTVEAVIRAALGGAT